MKDMNQQLIETLKSKEGKMIEIRRYLHQHQNYLFMKMKRRNTSLNFTKVKM